ncbi:MAG: SPASM domain-containing protein [Micrococcales bacterium]|nr:SPASM domain-containing protein [Micrococcales bacterium]
MDDLFGSAAARSFPTCTQVTLLHGPCNARCLACPVGRVQFGDADAASKAEFSRERWRTMPWEVFTTVADEVGSHPEAWLRLHARGEPLLHPRFVDMIAYAKNVGVTCVQAFTNAIALTEPRARTILETGLDTLECSVHGHDRTYEALMRTTRFEQVKANILGFLALRDALGAPTRVVVSAVDQPLFQPDKADHQAFWERHADAVIYRPYHSWGNRIDTGCSSVPETRHPCSQLWNRCTVGPTGNVLACFNSWTEEPTEVLGNVLDPKTTIADLWQSARFGELRTDHAAGRYTLPCCANCTDWTGSSWGENSYENLLRNRFGKAVG